MGKISELKKVFEENVTTLIISSIGFVAALAWNDAILTLFKAYFPTEAVIYPKFVYAVLVTLFAVLVTFWLSKLKNK